MQIHVGDVTSVRAASLSSGPQRPWKVLPSRNGPEAESIRQYTTQIEWQADEVLEATSMTVSSTSTRNSFQEQSSFICSFACHKRLPH